MTPEQEKIACPDRLLFDFIIAGRKFADECEGLLDALGLFEVDHFSTIVFPDSTESAARIRVSCQQPKGIYCEIDDFSHTFPGSTVRFAARKSGHLDMMKKTPHGHWEFRSAVDVAHDNPQELIVARQTIERVTGLF